MFIRFDTIHEHNGQTDRQTHTRQKTLKPSKQCAKAAFAANAVLGMTIIAVPNVTATHQRPVYQSPYYCIIVRCCAALTWAL